MDYEQFKEILILCLTEQGSQANGNELIEYIGHDPQRFYQIIDYCVLTINSTQQKEVIIIALSLVNYILNPQNYSPDEIRNKWNVNDFQETKDKLKQTLLNNISNNDVRIRNFCSFLISNILMIENNFDNFYNFCIFIYSEIKANNSLEYKSGLGCTLANIYNQPFIRNFKSMDLIDRYKNLISLHYEIFIFVVFLNEDKYLQLKQFISDSLFLLFDDTTELFTPNQIIGIINEIIRSNLISDNYQNEKLMNFLYNVICEWYNDIVEQFPTIFSIIQRIIETPNYQSAFDMLEKIIIFEDSNYKDNKYIISYLINSLQYFNNYLVFDLKDDDFKSTKSLKVSKILKLLNNIDSNKISPIIKNYIVNFQSNIDNDIYIFFLLLYILSSTQDIDKDFILDNIKFSINYICDIKLKFNSQIYLILPLYTLKQYFKNYRINMWMNSNLRNQIYETCMDLLRFKSSIVIKLDCLLLQKMLENNNNQNVLSDFYDYAFPKFIERIDNYDNEIYYVFMAFNTCIKNTTFLNESKIQELYSFILEKKFVQSNSIIKSGYCALLKTIIEKVNLNFIINTLSDTVNIILETMKQDQNQYFWEDSLITISTLIKKCKYEFNDFSEQVLNTLYQGFNLFVFEPFSMKILLCTLGNLFHYSGKKIINRAEEFLNGIFVFIDDSRKQPGFINMLPDAIRAIELTLEVQHSNININLIEMFINLINFSFENIGIDYEKNDLLMFLTVAFRSYSLIFKILPSDKLFEQCDRIFEILKDVWKYNLYDDNVLLEIYQLIYLIGNVLQEKVNVRLSKMFIRDLIQEGIKSENEKLKKTASFILNFVEEL